MEKEIAILVHSLKYLRQRKFLLFLPVLIVPFLTLLFWALGGGRVRAARTNNPITTQGLNLHLPEAHLKEERGLTKLSFYEQSEKDSLKLGAQASNDPFYASPLSNDSANDSALPHSGYVYDPTPPIGTYPKDPNEEKVYQKLNELNTVMNQSSSFEPDYSPTHSNDPYPIASPSSAPIGLEKTLQHLSNSGNTSSDTQLQQLNQMMDKILAIQHPEQEMQPKQETLSTNKATAIPVAVPPNACTISLLSDTGILSNETATATDSAIAFYSLGGVPPTVSMENTIPATVAQTQTLVNGSVVKLRLLQNILVQGQIIPEGTAIYGTAALNNERLTIQINTLYYNNTIYPLHLEAYDLDGLEGIYVPGALTREVAKQASDNALQSLDFTTFDHSLATQATSAGIQAAKSLLSKKVRAVKVTLKAGYQLLLKDKQY